MNFPPFFDPINSSNLFDFNENFKFISNLYLRQKLPKVLMLTGNKGTGKSTLVNHFLYSIFDTKNYDKKNLNIPLDSVFFNQLQNNFFQNIIYIKGADFKSVKIEDIRSLKSKILQSIISDRDRFIIFDDVELFNRNSLNALLKIMEEPSKKNYFFLINNKSKPLLETIKSRSIEIKIILKEKQRIEIINKLVSLFNLDLVLDPESSKLTPGNFVKFNYICNENNIIPTHNFVENLTLLLNLYKKNKNNLFINVIFFIIDYYFDNLKKNNFHKNERIFEIKKYIFYNLNNLILYNISQNSFINDINEKLNYE